MVDHRVLEVKWSNGIKVALLDRGSTFEPFIVAWAYDSNTHTWGQGHYFQNHEDAVNYYRTNY